MKLWKRCPLLLSLVVSGLAVTAASAANRDGIYREYERDTVMTPVLSVFFQGMKDDKYPWTTSEMTDALVQIGPGEAPETLEQAESVPNGEAGAAGQAVSGQGEDPAASGEMAKAQEAAEETAEETAGEANAEINEETAAETPEETEQAPEIRVENVQVEESYFDDALFIGDSRTQGLKEYGGFGENVTFYSKISLNIYDLFEKNKAFIKEDDRKLTLEQALTERQFRKIYLMIGINELGTGTPETFLAAYADAVNKIRELQPEAVIFVQAIMRVGAQKNASDPVFNNENINVRNAQLATLADHQTVFYLDINEAVCDENGNLYDDWTFDQIHLKAKYYQVWKEYLMSHGVV